VINIGEGDLNADWIKYVDGGRHQRNEFRAHEQALLNHYEETGEAEKAEAARKRLEELGPWEYGEGEGPQAEKGNFTQDQGFGEDDGFEDDFEDDEEEMPPAPAPAAARRPMPSAAPRRPAPAPAPAADDFGGEDDWGEEDDEDDEDGW